MSDPMPPRPSLPVLRLLGASSAALALELALIRWLPARMRVVAYFPNVVLLASFLGLGLGALTTRRARESRARSGALPQGSPAPGSRAWAAVRSSTAVAMLVLVVAAWLGSKVAFTSTAPSEHLWLLYHDLPPGAPVVQSVAWPVFALFLLIVLPFIGLGASIGDGLAAFQDAGRTVHGYAVDLAGSLMGTLAFVVMSACGARPIAWFALPAAIVVALMRGRSARVLALAAGIGALALVSAVDDADVYSPYYALRTEPESNGLLVLANGMVHQRIMDVRTGHPAPGSIEEAARAGYRVPLVNLDHLPRRALVLGAGTGNDVAVLLDAGVPEIHAVEIDPGILAIGRALHPAHPYDDPRVTVHVGDARTFLEGTKLDFDYIVFGTLDSLTRLSALSNVRLDNFVYTKESIAQARAHLTADGGMALFFMVNATWIDDHLHAILDAAFGEPPLLYTGQHRMFNRIYMAGPAFARLEGVPQLRDEDRRARRASIVAPSDDWPYLYLAGRTIPAFYLGLIALIAAASMAAVLGVSRSMRGELSAGRVDAEMMLFGAAFLLLETGFVTDMNLLFGATWLTSAIVFASVLAALLGATLLATRIRVPAAPALVVVAAWLIVLSRVPLRTVAPVGLPARVAFVLVTCGVPLGCAALAFADRYRVSERVESAFGWNLLGAVIGGLLEFLSMATGLRALMLLAAALYLVIVVRLLRARRHVAAAG